MHFGKPIQCTPEGPSMHFGKLNLASCRVQPCKFANAWLDFCERNQGSSRTLPALAAGVTGAYVSAIGTLPQRRLRLLATHPPSRKRYGGQTTRVISMIHPLKGKTARIIPYRKIKYKRKLHKETTGTKKTKATTSGSSLLSLPSLMSLGDALMATRPTLSHR